MLKCSKLIRKGVFSLEESKKRGRGKVKPSSDLSIESIKSILLEKIDKENSELIFDSSDEELLKKVDYNDQKFNVVGLFSGCGGLDLGFELAGLSAAIGEKETIKAFEDKDLYNQVRHNSVFHTIYTNDMFKEANETYKNNFPSHVIQHQKDIRKVSHFPVCNVMLGGFPCPGFSEGGPRLIDDERNFLYLHFIRALMQTKPEFFVAENVKGMLTLGKGEVIKQIVQDFSSAGYKVSYQLFNSRDYGVPQLRERVFLVGVREDLDFKYEFPEPSHGDDENLLPFVTLRDAIGDLEEEPGPYHVGSFSSIYMSRNRKKKWEDQSFTIQASGRQAPLHPSGESMRKVGKDKWVFQGDINRRLSLKEIARIQTFPDWFEFSHGNAPTKDTNGQIDKIYKQIGNAVPVLLAKAIAQPIAKYAHEKLQEGYKPISSKSLQTSLF